MLRQPLTFTDIKPGMTLEITAEKPGASFVITGKVNETFVGDRIQFLFSHYKIAMVISTLREALWLV